MFNQGATEIATLGAVQDANQQINQIKAQMTNEGEQRAALQETANQLALRLAGVGASGTQINAAFESIAPQQFGSAEQMQLFGAANNSQFLEDTGERLIKEREQRGLNAKLRLQQTKQVSGLGKEMRQNVKDRQKEFNRLTAKTFERYSQVKLAQDSLKKKNPIADQAIKTMLARASGEVGNLTEAERAMFEGSPEIRAMAKRLFAKRAVGILPPEDRQSLQELIQLYLRGTQGYLQRNAQLISSQMAGNTGMDKDQAMSLILPESVRAEFEMAAPGETEPQSVTIDASGASQASQAGPPALMKYRVKGR